ncbi:gastric triacylglycerol lipase [Aplysia californica]|uniref:Gastric triacylglycerol lipase n=1 Tax=Aplysia californica TaxID=6500 RepID=A0ABM1A5X0_APLCA|nr:gastric triacylglycerol lipase [Aplysia californica]XP_012941444.1 gastric triacylglycerol lipase [Aplysia californica]XP_012941445.1 gastric triacylglycerol lipase [Aplysia californica]XP_012941447.1 gastric triacylglycerol lipase [Aplysia californica]XP_012941448.1 gastric triacylglycerol lipase [Aplysia californica]
MARFSCKPWSLLINFMIFLCCLTVNVSADDLGHFLRSESGDKITFSSEKVLSLLKRFGKSEGDYSLFRQHESWQENVRDSSRLGGHVFRKNKLDPDARKNMTELILSQGYISEKYTVQTEDGFLLDVHRIPSGRGEIPISSDGSGRSKPVVFLQHGLLSSSCDWVMNFANGSLGFILADAGYDVWMGNSRGNTLSRKHVKLRPGNPKFWDWSFDEMAKYDLTAFIDFVLNKTNQSSLSYVGHSQGTTMAFALFSQRPDMQKKVNIFVTLAPVTLISNTVSLVQYLAEIPDEILFAMLGRRDFLPSDLLVRTLVDLLCHDEATRWVCYNILFILAGPDLTNLNQTRLEVYMNHSPAGASVKDIVHFAQIYREKKFLMYDFGSPSENMKHYNQTSPPEYVVTNITVPVLAFTGTDDWLSDPEDASALLNSLPDVISWVVLDGWNHLDFVWGENAAQLCYHPIVQWLHKFSLG